jgi:carboxylesterase type B
MSANSKSGPAYAPTGVALDALAAEVGCGTGSGQLDCLREVDLYDLETAYFNSTTNPWFCPAIDDITRFSNYEARYQAGQYPSHVPLITGNSNGEGTIFSIVYGAENTDFASWINTFDADVAHIPDDVLLAAYNASDFTTVSLESGTQYGDARFDCAVDYLLDLRSAQQNTWLYRFFGAYDNVVGVPGTAPTHGTEIPFFLGGNECFSALSNVTDAEQALADSINDWFVEWIKGPAKGPGWEMVSEGGVVALLAVPGNETEVLLGDKGEYYGICESVSCPFRKV